VAVDSVPGLIADALRSNEWVDLRGFVELGRPFRRRKRPNDDTGKPGAGLRCHLAEVRLQEGETVENALRRFKRQVVQENIIGEVKRHSFYLKPGQRLRVKKALARKRNRKKARQEHE
jgi:small subunit ribosomal protein S21